MPTFSATVSELNSAPRSNITPQRRRSGSASLVAQANHFPAEHTDRARYRLQQHDDGAQQRGFSAATAANQRKDLTGTHRQADILMHHGLPVARVQCADIDDGAGLLRLVSSRHSQVEPVENNGKQRIGQDDQKNGLHHAHRRLPADAVGAAAYLKALITSDQCDDHGKYRCFDDAGQEGGQADRVAEAVEENARS